MASSPTAHHQAGNVPAVSKTKRIAISDPIQMPEVYSSTPGGTLYSTTPGGTRLIYDREYLKELRNSPLSQSPPMANIPINLLRSSPLSPSRKCVPPPITNDLIKKTQSIKIEEQEQFQLEL